MKNLSQTLIAILISMLVVLWCYASVNKLIEFSHFRHEMINQVIPRPLSEVLVYLIPVSELTAAIFLCKESLRWPGLCLSLFLMTVFTAYIALVYFNFFNRVPCSCGGILKSMGWGTHLIFNLSFLLITLSAIYLYQRERRLRQ